VDDAALAAKTAAAEAGASRVRAGQRVALGTGSTASLAIRAIARRFPAEGALELVASSSASEQLAQQLGLAVRALRGDDRFDLMLDGADEFDPALALVKGGGGALFREKLLARLSTELVVLVDPSKQVERLGVARRVPVEIVPYARAWVAARLADSGGDARLRNASDGSPFLSDNGNEILDVAWPGGVPDVAATEHAVRAIPGVVEVGLFVKLASRVLVGRNDGTVTEHIG
jgi:ribose 5-phosphate isomerase A